MESKAKEWLEQADADYITAQVLLKSKRYYASVSFSQQSAEKALKSVYLVEKSSLAPKIHDLLELARLVGTPKKIKENAEKLTGTYFTSRYPDAAPSIPVRYYTLQKAQEHLYEAEVILQWPKSKIQ